MNYKQDFFEEESNGTFLFYAGQAGYIVKNMTGELLAVDLYLSDCVERLEGHIGFKRLQPSVVDATRLNLDCVVATHPHWDHYDVDSIPIFMSNKDTNLIASVKCNEYINESKIDKTRVTYVKPGDMIKKGDFELHFINCDHGIGAPDAVGLIICTDGYKIVMTGDTCLRLDRVSEYTKLGKPDILIGPINGAYGNMNENDFATLSESVSPKLTIPCHFGMFASHGGNPGKFIEIMNKTNAKYTLMTPGEILNLQKI